MECMPSQPSSSMRQEYGTRSHSFGCSQRHFVSLPPCVGNLCNNVDSTPAYSETPMHEKAAKLTVVMHGFRLLCEGLVRKKGSGEANVHTSHLASHDSTP